MPLLISTRTTSQSIIALNVTAVGIITTGFVASVKATARNSVNVFASKIQIHLFSGIQLSQMNS